MPDFVPSRDLLPGTNVPVASAANADALDICRWAREQAGVLDAANLAALDRANLAVFLRATADDIRSNALGALRVLCECGLRLHYGPPGEHRVAQKVLLTRSARLRATLERSPSIRPWLAERLPEAWQKARRAELEDYARLGIATAAIPLDCPWSLAQIMAPAF